MPLTRMEKLLLKQQQQVIYIALKLIIFLQTFNYAGVAEIILRTQSKLSLKCIAAKAIKRYSLSYKGQVPRPLEGFIELHGPGTTLR